MFSRVMDLALDDMVVLVTGASGGIGGAVVRAFEAEGARVAAWSRRGVDERPRVQSFTADVTSRASIDDAMQQTVASLGRVDACIVNAGIWPDAAVPLAAMDDARIGEVIGVNLVGAMRTARAFLAQLALSGPRDDGRGASVVFIGSTAGRFGEEGHSEYAATKAALGGLVRSLKNEIVRVDARGRVNLVEPGWTVTPMAEKTLAADGSMDRVTRTMALRQLATPEDVAAAVLFFTSPALARHVSGETLTVAGGMEGRTLW